MKRNIYIDGQYLVTNISSEYKIYDLVLDEVKVIVMLDREATHNINMTSQSDFLPGATAIIKCDGQNDIIITIHRSDIQWSRDSHVKIIGELSNYKNI